MAYKKPRTPELICQSTLVWWFEIIICSDKAGSLLRAENAAHELKTFTWEKFHAENAPDFLSLLHAATHAAYKGKSKCSDRDLQQSYSSTNFRG